MPFFGKKKVCPGNTKVKRGHCKFKKGYVCYEKSTGRCFKKYSPNELPDLEDTTYHHKDRGKRLRLAKKEHELSQIGGPRKSPIVRFNPITSISTNGSQGKPVKRFTRSPAMKKNQNKKKV